MEHGKRNYATKNRERENMLFPRKFTVLVLTFQFVIAISKVSKHSLGTLTSNPRRQEQNGVVEYQADDVKREPCFGVTDFRNLKNIENKQLRNRCRRFLKRCFSAKTLVKVKEKLGNMSYRQQ